MCTSTLRSKERAEQEEGGESGRDGEILEVMFVVSSVVVTFFCVSTSQCLRKMFVEPILARAQLMIDTGKVHDCVDIADLDFLD